MSPSHTIARLQWPASPRWLAALRIALGIEIFWALQRRLVPFLLETDRTLSTKSYFPETLEELLWSLLPVLRAATSIVAIFFALGLATRLVTPLLLGLYILTYTPIYLRFDAPVPWLYELAPLIFLYWARTADVWSVDALYRSRKRRASGSPDPRIYRWPLEATTCWFVIIYLWAAVAKFIPIREGLQWGDGGIIRYILYTRFLDSPSSWLLGRPLFNYVDTTWPFTILAVVALATELSVILLLLTRATHVVVLGGLFGMHVFLAFIGVFGFLEHFLVLAIAVAGTAFRPNLTTDA